MKTSLPFSLPAILLTLALTIPLAGAQTVVTTTIDEDDGDANPANGNGTSLREAISYAAANSIVTFTNTLAGETLLLTNSITISQNIAINGSGLDPAVTIDGGGSNRLFTIQASQTAAFIDLMLTGGDAGSASGGAFANLGTLRIQRCTIYNNTAGSFGGAIRSTGSLSLTNCTMTGNSSTTNGGAIYSSGTLSLDQSTIAGNTSGGAGGGIFKIGSSVGIHNTIVAENSAVTDDNIDGSLSSFGINITSGDPMLAPLGDYGGPTLTMPPLPGSPAIDQAGGDTNSVFSTDQRGSMRVVNGIVDAGAVEVNHVVTEQEDSIPGSLRHIVEYASPSATITFDPALAGQTLALTNEQITIEKNINIDASALADSVIIDAMGSNRLFQCTIGTTNTFTALTLTGGEALGARGGAIINTSVLTLERCTLTGNHADIDGGAIRNNNNAMLTLNNTTLAGNSANNGGAVYNNVAGTLYLNHITCTDNVATNLGGGIRNFGTMDLANSIVAGNTASSGDNIFNSGTQNDSGINITSGDPMLAPLGNYGGPTPTMPPLSDSPAIDPVGGTNTSTFATDQRGALRVVGGIVDVGAVEVQPTVVTAKEDSVFGSLRYIYDYALPDTTITFTNTLSGQTLALTNGQITIEKSFNIDGSALANGIIIDAMGSNRLFRCENFTTNTFTALTLTGGYSSFFAGAIYAERSDLTLQGCTLYGNAADLNGGAIRSHMNGSLTLENCAVFDNHAGGNGGGIFGSTIIHLNNSTISGNSATTGGGISGTGTFKLNSSTVSGNSATNGGGIFLNSSETSYLTNSIVAGNTAYGSNDNIYTEATIITSGINITNGVAQLAPLGDYGGPTWTMPPLPGSPAIDPAGGDTNSVFTTDQRGYARVTGGILDVGAAEYKTDDRYYFWALDTDGDGNAFGVEYALGTDWFTADATNSANLAGFTTNGQFAATFGYNSNAADIAVWQLLRSTNLVTDPFMEVFSYVDGITYTNIPMNVVVGPDSLEVTDLSDPQPTNAFYRFRAAEQL